MYWQVTRTFPDTFQVWLKFVNNSRHCRRPICVSARISSSNGEIWVKAKVSGTIVAEKNNTPFMASAFLHVSVTFFKILQQKRTKEAQWHVASTRAYTIVMFRAGVARCSQNSYNDSKDINTLRTGAFKLFKCTFPGSKQFKSTFILCFFKYL